MPRKLSWQERHDHVSTLNLFGEVDEARQKDAALQARIDACPIKVGDWVQSGKGGIVQAGAMVEVVDRIYEWDGNLYAHVHADGAFGQGGKVEDLVKYPGDPFAPAPGTEHIPLPDLTDYAYKDFYGPLSAQAYRDGYADFERGQPFDDTQPTGLLTPKEWYLKGWLAAGGTNPYEERRKKQAEDKAAAANAKRAATRSKKLGKAAPQPTASAASTAAPPNPNPKETETGSPLDVDCPQCAHYQPGGKAGQKCQRPSGHGVFGGGYHDARKREYAKHVDLKAKLDVVAAAIAAQEKYDLVQNDWVELLEFPNRPYARIKIFHEDQTTVTVASSMLQPMNRRVSLEQLKKLPVGQYSKNPIPWGWQIGDKVEYPIGHFGTVVGPPLRDSYGSALVHFEDDYHGDKEYDFYLRDHKPATEPLPPVPGPETSWLPRPIFGDFVQYRSLNGLVEGRVMRDSDVGPDYIEIVEVGTDGRPAIGRTFHVHRSRIANISKTGDPRLCATSSPSSSAGSSVASPPSSSPSTTPPPANKPLPGPTPTSTTPIAPTDDSPAAMRGAGATVIGEIGRDDKGRPWRIEGRWGPDFMRYGLAYLDPQTGWHAEQYGRTYDSAQDAQDSFDRNWNREKKCTSTLPSSSPPSGSSSLSSPASSSAATSATDSLPNDAEDDDVFELTFAL